MLTKSEKKASVCKGILITKLEQDVEQDRNITVKTYCNRKLKEFKNNKRAAYFRDVEIVVKLLCDDIGKEKLTDVRLHDMHKFVEHRKSVGSLNHRVKTLCNKTINDITDIVKMIFE